MDEQIVITETPSLTGNSPSVVNSVSQKTRSAMEGLQWNSIIRYTSNYTHSCFSWDQLIHIFR